MFRYHIFPYEYSQKSSAHSQHYQTLKACDSDHLVINNQYVVLYVFVCTKTIEPKKSTQTRHHHHNLPLAKINNHVSNGSMLAC